MHPRYGTPAVSIIAGTVWAMVLAASGTFEQLLTYVVFVGWIFYALGAACVFVLRRTQPDAARPFRVPGYPWTPLLFIVAAVALVGNTIATQPAAPPSASASCCSACRCISSGAPRECSLRSDSAAAESEIQGRNPR